MDEVAEAMRKVIISGESRGDWELTTVDGEVWIISIRKVAGLTDS